MIRPTNKPILLDAFCGAGGATKGYQRAGFYVVGVDHKRQPRYCGDEFIQADALEFIERHGREFDAIHASPPCQKYSSTQTLAANVEGFRTHRDRIQHPDIIEPLRNRLIATGKPYIIENVIGAPLVNPILLCGTMFGLRVLRHRIFEHNVMLFSPDHPEHNGSTNSHRGFSKDAAYICVAGHNFAVAQARAAMGIDWMGQSGLAQAIPPAYTEFIGVQLMRIIIALEAR